MSDVTTEAAPPPAETEPPAAATTEAAPPPDPQAATDATDAPADPPPGEEPWRKVRIEQMARQKNEAQRERDLIARERDELRSLVSELRAGRDPDAQKADEARVEARARELALRELSAREKDVGNQKFLEVGRKEFSDFDERCSVVAQCGATSRPEFMDVIRLMDDGHRVVMHLADNPAEATRILNLEPHAMGLALARLETQVKPKASAPKPVSQAPKPVTPVTGAVVPNADIYDPNLSMREYRILREKQIKAREEARR